MKRSKRHKVKQEMPDASTSRGSYQKEHDLAYYIHDRVELMHQVFSVLKHKEIKAMAPECVRHISASDLQELCMEELLGISSKRLCAILDGADPPSDTESSSESSPDRFETISLDSISSDDEILSQVSSKKSKKHKHRSKSKSKKRKNKERESESNDKDQEDRSRRAGLTMLELLELQARARAIRAQLQKEQAMAASTEKQSETVTGDSSDGEVEIKEEAAEVVEISSEDEKPNVQELEGNNHISANRKEPDSSNQSNSSKTITKKVNDLVITVPQTKSSRKIKLKRNAIPEKAPEKIKNVATSSNNTVAETAVTDTSCDKRKDTTNIVATKAVVETNNPKETTRKGNTREVTIDLDTDSNDKSKNKDKKKKKKKEKQKDKDGSDHDEITLQLSDTEKMDLLEDLDGKKTKKVSDSEDSSEDSDSESDSDSVDENKKNESDVLTKERNSGNESVKTKSNTENSIIIDSISSNTKAVQENESVKNNSKTNIENNSNTDKNNKDIQTLSNTKADANENAHKATLNENNSSVEERDRQIVISDVEELNTLDSEKQKPKSGFTDNAIEVTSIIDIPIGNLDDDNAQSSKDTANESEESKAQTVESEIVENCHKIQHNEPTTVDDKEKSGGYENVLQRTEIDAVILKAQDVTIEKSIVVNICDEVVDLESQADSSSVKEVLQDKSDGELSESREKSEGEISDRDSSEVEASGVKSDVVCISDEEEKIPKKKKKKEKKSKKEKKCKKKKDFRESADQNFYTQTAISPKPCSKDDVIVISETNTKDETNDTNSGDVKIENHNNSKVAVDHETNSKNEFEQIKIEISPKSEKLSNTDIDDDVYEILELSDDSSCYEVEEISISKEPTTEEIEAFTAKIDEIESDGSIGVNVTKENKNPHDDVEDLENVSWKDRYLKSTKVKKVLSTASILNAIRKKNLQLKKKIQESKEEKTEEIVIDVPKDSGDLEEGTIQHYNTLEASTKYVDPVKEIPPENADTKAIDTENVGDEKTNEKDKQDTVNSDKEKVTKEMKKDAKQLLKMYKMLLKYNDISKQDDSNKKKKKKKKSKEKDKGASNPTSVTR